MTALKVTSLAMLAWITTMFVVKYLIPAVADNAGLTKSSNPGIFIFPLMGVGYAVYRLNAIVFWKNAVVMVATTLVSTFIAGFGSL